MVFSTEWSAGAASRESVQTITDAHDRGIFSVSPFPELRQEVRPTPGPSIEPYVRPEYAREMRGLRGIIGAAAQRHNHPAISGMSDDDFAVLIAQIMYNENFGWFEERVTPVQMITPFYEDMQRQTNAAGISNYSIWPANLRPSVAIEVLRGQLPLPHSTQTITIPVSVYGSAIRPASFHSTAELYAAVTDEIAQPQLAVEYLAANLERGVYRARRENVPVTWRALAAWHNQGIVSPEDIRANKTAWDYVRRASAYIGPARELMLRPTPDSLKALRIAQ